MVAENFEDGLWTESDPNNHLSHTSSRSTFTTVAKDESCYFSKDKGAEHFDLSEDFEHLFDFRITASGGGSGCWIAFWALENTLADYMDGKASSDALQVLYYDSTSQIRKVKVQIIKDTTVYGSSYIPTSLTVGTTYYAKVTWTASTNTLTLYVYTDSERTILFGSTSISQSGVDNLRYIMCPQSATATAGTTVSGYVENLDLQEGGAVFKEVTDSFGLSDAVLRDKMLAVSDFVGLVDVSLKHWAPQVLDSVGLSDAVLRGRRFSVFDSVSVGDLVSVLTEMVKQVTDSVSLSDVVGLGKVLLLGDQIGLGDSVCVGKVLVVSDGVVLVEVVEKSVQGVVKTRVFLVMGDLAIQLTG